LIGNISYDSTNLGGFNVSGTIEGDLTVNTENTTVYNYAVVTGTITIKDVASATWNECVDGNTIVIDVQNNPTKNIILNVRNDKTVGKLEIKTQATVITTK
jgi:uncharacterized protein YaiE (UPF0345 family)